MLDTKLKNASQLRDELLSSETDARRSVNALFDEGTFVELGAYVRRSADEFGTGDDFEGVITGYGAINGRLVFAFVQDFEKDRGALTSAHADKICRLYDAALKSHAPIIGVFNSAGAHIKEGVGALAGYGRIMKAVSKARGVVPQIALISGLCSGAAAAVCGMFDFVLAQEGAELFVAPPFLVREKLGDKDAGSVSKAYANGSVTATAADTASAAQQIRELLCYLPQNSLDGTAEVASSDDANRLTPAVEGILAAPAYDMLSVVAEIADDRAVYELWSGYAKEMLTCFIRINSKVVGVNANDPSVNGGALSAAAASKAARFADFCSCFGIPLLTLVDTEGTEITEESENAPYHDALACLAAAYSSAECALVTVVLGKAYGSAFTLMGSRAIGADVAFAVDNAKISMLPPESAVEFVYNEQIKESKDPDATRKELLDEWSSVSASPVTAAREGAIDDIIASEELRQRIAAAFEMLAFKSADNV